MRAIGPLLLACACAAKPAMTTPAPATPVADLPATVPVASPAPATATSPAEVMASDTPKTTVAGNRFIAPVGWSVAVRGPATILTAPEGDSRVALVDVSAKSDDEAVALAWAAYDPSKKYRLVTSIKGADANGWTQTKGYEYQTSPNEKRVIGANALFANGTWTIVIVDMAEAVLGKRGAQLSTALGVLYPKGYDAENFKGKQAHDLDKARVQQLTEFVDSARQQLRVPGVALGIVQHGKVVFAGGFGVRELGKPAKVDADTKFMIASNTKALTTLMLAKLVEEKKLAWDTSATSLLDSFKLGDADTTSKVQVKHLICACTGMPRQDFEWLLEFKNRTPASVVQALGTMQPTSKFGELFQYSNPLAAAAGFIGGHVAYPALELGKAYDQAMQTRVFGPLGMSSTTLDMKKGMQGNAAVAHSVTIDGEPTRATDAINWSIVPVRPAGGAWSNVKDMLKYVQMELANGMLPNGKPYLAADILLARRAPQVALDSESTYGMGLMVSTAHGVTVVHHGGDMIGMHSDMMWLPDHDVGLVVLTNGDPGWQIRGEVQRKLLEVLFDATPEANDTISVGAKAYRESLAAGRKLLTVPAEAAAVKGLATQYTSAALGDLTVRTGAKTVFDFGEFASEVATKTNPDGTVSFVTIAPGIAGFDFVPGTADGKRTLILRDAQHEYVLREK